MMTTNLPNEQAIFSLSFNNKITFQVCNWKLLQVNREVAKFVITLSFVVKNISQFVAADLVGLSCDVNRHINFENIYAFAKKMNTKLVSSK